MGGEQQGASIERREPRGHGALVRGVEVGGGLVDQPELAALHGRRGELHELALAPRERVERARPQRGEVVPGDRGLDGGEVVRCRAAPR